MQSNVQYIKLQFAIRECLGKLSPQVISLSMIGKVHLNLDSLCWVAKF